MADEVIAHENEKVYVVFLWDDPHFDGWNEGDLTDTFITKDYFEAIGKTQEWIQTYNRKVELCYVEAYKLAEVGGIRVIYDDGDG